MKRAMKEHIRPSLVSITLASLLFGFITAPSAQAETFAFTSSPLTNRNPAGATINGGLSKFPVGNGRCIQQGIDPDAGSRPPTGSSMVQNRGSH